MMWNFEVLLRNMQLLLSAVRWLMEHREGDVLNMNCLVFVIDDSGSCWIKTRLRWWIWRRRHVELYTIVYSQATSSISSEEGAIGYL